MPELRAFVIKLRQDLPAAQASVISSYNQGPVEGHIHRLKLLKRSVYSRGNFDLLKQRVHFATGAPSTSCLSGLRDAPIPSLTKN